MLMFTLLLCLDPLRGALPASAAANVAAAAAAAAAAAGASVEAAVARGRAAALAAASSYMAQGAAGEVATPSPTELVDDEDVLGDYDDALLYSSLNSSYNDWPSFSSGGTWMLCGAGRRLTMARPRRVCDGASGSQRHSPLRHRRLGRGGRL